MEFSISPLGICGGQKCPKKNGRTHFIQECFQIPMCWPRHTVFVHEKWDFPFHYWMFLTPLSRELSSQGHQDISVMSKKFQEAAFLKCLSKFPSEHPAVYRGVISECSSCFWQSTGGEYMFSHRSWGSNYKDMKQVSVCSPFPPKNRLRASDSAEEHSVVFSCRLSSQAV